MVKVGRSSCCRLVRAWILGGDIQVNVISVRGEMIIHMRAGWMILGTQACVSCLSATLSRMRQIIDGTAGTESCRDGPGDFQVTCRYVGRFTNRPLR